MLFNSYLFILLFVPIVVAGYFMLGRLGSTKIGLSWLIACSLFFYGYYNPAYLALLGISVLANYGVGRLLSGEGVAPKTRFRLASGGVVFNLALLGYYKYANFFVENINVVFGSDFVLEKLLLPLAISFFTFQQLAYVVDSYQGKTRRYGFVEYTFFVTFFPQLIAGPIVRHEEMMPQLKKNILQLNPTNLASGTSLFCIGLFKKVIFADQVARYVQPVYDGLGGADPGFTAAWLATFAYSLQLYFDFSGYSDMASGLARIFNLTLPQNFDSPYRAESPTSFWRRWHCTLSAFLKQYLYFPLGGNRKGETRTNINLFLTMLLGGLWHGAGWGYIIWGALNGVLLLGQKAWSKTVGKRLGVEPSRFRIELSITTTFFLIMLTRIFFRAESWDGSMSMLRALLGMGGVDVVESAPGLFPGIAMAVGLYLVARLAPNSMQIMADVAPVLGKIRPGPRWLRWRPNGTFAVVVFGMFVICIVNLAEVSEFLYFQF